MDNPCTGCLLRTEDCHDDYKCRKGGNLYVEWKRFLSERKEEHDKSIAGDKAAAEYEIHRTQQAIKGRLKRNRK